MFSVAVTITVVMRSIDTDFIHKHVVVPILMSLKTLLNPNQLLCFVFPEPSQSCPVNTAETYRYGSCCSAGQYNDLDQRSEPDEGAVPKA